MKRTWCLSVSMLAAGACQGMAAGEDVPWASPPPPGVTVEVDPNRRVVAADPASGRVALATVTDWTGLVTATVWECTSDENRSHQAIQCSVGADQVLVGGGARTVSGSGAGAFLTASFPVDSTLTKWEARSKDHGLLDEHQLKVYAIGLKLRGVDRGKLRSNIFVNTAQSHPAHHPSASAPEFAPTILELGGGARVNWEGPGNMLTAAYASVATGKDHVWEDASSITHWRIGIRSVISDFGHLTARNVASVATVNSGFSSTTKDITSGWVPVSIGAIAGGSTTVGRLLTAMSPATGNTATSFVAESRDHLGDDGGTLMLIVGELRKQFQ